jgi:hypothetical protein
MTLVPGTCPTKKCAAHGERMSVHMTTASPRTEGKWGFECTEALQPGGSFEQKINAVNHARNQKVANHCRGPFSSDILASRCLC